MAARSERTLRELIRVIAGRFLGMVIVFVLVVAAAGVATWRAPKWYQSEVELLARPSELGSPLEPRGDMRDEVVLYISTLRSMIASDHVLASALMRLDPKYTPPVMPKGQEPPAVPKGEKNNLSDRAAIKKWGADVKKWNKEVKKYVLEHTEEISKLRERLSVVTPGGPDATFTQILKVQVIWPEDRDKTFESRDASREDAAKRAQTIADSVVTAYRQRYAELEWESATATTEFLSNKSLATAKLARDKTVDNYAKFIKDYTQADILDMQHMSGRGGSAGTGKASLTTKYAGEVASIDETVAGLRSILEALDTQIKKADDDTIAVPDSIMASNPSVRAIETQILTLKAHINSLTPRYTDDHKELMTARSELAATRKEFRNELNKQLTRINQKIASFTARRDQISKSVTAERTRLSYLAVLLPKWESLRDDKAEAQTMYSNEQTRVAKANTARELAKAEILLTVLGDASQPDAGKPAKPVMLVNLILAVVGGFILALIYAFSADHFDHSLKGIDDAERYLGVPVLASVPKLGRRMIRAKRGVK